MASLGCAVFFVLGWAFWRFDTPKRYRTGVWEDPDA